MQGKYEEIRPGKLSNTKQRIERYSTSLRHMNTTHVDNGVLFGKANQTNFDPSHGGFYCLA